ncbi:FecCD family ABC transporter permease [Bacillus horti]|uniref:Iron complex transport system permease protein n=1 Tax=Caldalkalibacillus horti TaxID=77523 RepID=A0ABT9VZV1_9BACI|nr:iron ABC transporter permease [Bacillus horti]MDQ0166501.1 iron complex transport system permease protein [Bacillus horti]
MSLNSSNVHPNQEVSQVDPIGWEQVRERKMWRLWVVLAFLVLALVSVTISISKGTMTIPWRNVWSYLIMGGEGSAREVIWNIRFPRTLIGAMVGINLAIAGAILQGVMKNPLADPQIIGVNAGAGFFAIILLILYPQYSHLVTPVAFVGAMLAAIIIYILSWKDGIRPIRIILAGVAVSAFFGAGITGLLVFYSDRVHGAMMFMAGSLSTRSWPQFETLLPYTIVGLILALLYAKRLNILLLGDENARSLGINVEGTRLILTAVAALLAASAVGIVGLLGFVGLIVPHAARLLVGNDYRILLPASALLGVGVVTLSDTLARVAFSPTEIPVGVVMAVIGAPFFLYLLRREAR